MIDGFSVELFKYLTGHGLAKLWQLQGVTPGNGRRFASMINGSNAPVDSSVGRLLTEAANKINFTRERELVLPSPPGYLVWYIHQLQQKLMSGISMKGYEDESDKSSTEIFLQRAALNYQGKGRGIVLVRGSPLSFMTPTAEVLPKALKIVTKGDTATIIISEEVMLMVRIKLFNMLSAIFSYINVSVNVGGLVNITQNYTTRNWDLVSYGAHTIGSCPKRLVNPFLATNSRIPLYSLSITGLFSDMIYACASIETYVIDRTSFQSAVLMFSKMLHESGKAAGFVDGEIKEH